MVDICKRYGKKKLLWFGDKAKTLAYTPKADEMVLSVHRWFANKACPGDYIYNRLPTIAEEVTKRLSGVDSVSSAQPKATYPSGAPTSKEAYIEACGTIARGLYKETKILPSVVTAQCCLETGFGRGSDSTQLVSVNNLLGMKTDLINSTWQQYSVWGGKSITKVTPEYVNGKLVYKTDSFRVYSDYENCIRDYEMFLLHVRNNKGLKYARVAGMTDPAEVIHAIRIGTGTDKNPEGYCTDPAYETKILNLIKQYGLTKYDGNVQPVKKAVYRVQVSKKAYKKLATAKKRVNTVKRKSGLESFYEQGTDGKYIVYCGSFNSKANAEARVKFLNSKNVKIAFVVEK